MELPEDIEMFLCPLFIPTPLIDINDVRHYRLTILTHVLTRYKEVMRKYTPITRDLRTWRINTYLKHSRGMAGVDGG
jgi:hypothetical protein